MFGGDIRARLPTRGEEEEGEREGERGLLRWVSMVSYATWFVLPSLILHFGGGRTLPIMITHTKPAASHVHPATRPLAERAGFEGYARAAHGGVDVGDARCLGGEVETNSLALRQLSTRTRNQPGCTNDAACSLGKGQTDSRSVVLSFPFRTIVLPMGRARRWSQSISIEDRSFPSVSVSTDGSLPRM